MKDYKQVDPKTIKFDFINTKIKVNNEDESKWVYKAALANDAKPIFGDENNVHPRNEGWYFSKHGTEYTSENFEEYGEELKEITIQDILNKRELIGYIIKAEFKKLESLILRAVDAVSGKYPDGTLIKPGFQAEKNAIALGVLDKWFEPIYESQSIVVKISDNQYGKRSLTANPDKSNFLLEYPTAGQPSNITVNFNDFKKIRNLMYPVITYKGYNVKFTGISIGCQEFTLEDIESIYKVIHKE